MINFNSILCDFWNKKIVYAPNGFGKTTNSMKLNDYYKSCGSRPLLFTRKKIESLVSNYGSIIYFGETAINAEENRRIAEKYNQSDSIKKFFKSNYGSYSIKRIKQISFFVQKCNLKKLDDFQEILSLKCTSDEIFNEDEAITIDQKLQFDLYEESNILLKSNKDIKKTKDNKRIQLVDKSIINCIEELTSLAEKNKTNNCPLCGKRFSSKDKLMEALLKKRNFYKVVEKKNLYDTLLSVTDKIHELYYEDSTVGKYLYNFDDDMSNIRGMVKLIKNYYMLCEKLYLSMLKVFENIKIDSDTSVGDLKKKYNHNEKKILSEKNNISNINLFTKFIVKELEEIISVDNNVTFKPIPNKLEVTIVFDDNQQTVALYDNLSESEIKRFSLVVLRALIKYGKYDTLILDDPIDSYDDYYTLVACEYIKNIVTESKLTNWYILTNDFMALSNISAIIRCDCIIYYYIPDDIFTENSFRIDNFVSNYREIEKATQSELQLLRDFLKGKLNADEKLSYISLIVTLRNFKSLILKNYDKLLIKEGKKIANSVARYDTDEKFNDDISLVVEHYYMHYDEKINPDLKINSNTIEVKKIINLYNRICKSKSRLLANYGKDNSSLCDMRELVAKTPFGLFDGSKIINLIFCKICIVSYLKYEFEKQLITKLKGKYKFSNDDIDKICRTNALGKKIEKAKELSFLNSYNAESYLNDYKSVLEKNKLLINLFGHALNQMFPPYIATNVKDIKKFKKEIDRLDKSH